jgi:hypothetical protein
MGWRLSSKSKAALELAAVLAVVAMAATTKTTTGASE